MKHFYANPPLKTQIVKRFNQTLKQWFTGIFPIRLNSFNSVDQQFTFANSVHVDPDEAARQYLPCLHFHFDIHLQQRICSYS